MFSSSSIVTLVLSIGLASSFSLSFKNAAVSRQALSIKNYQSSHLFSKVNVDKKRDLALFAASEETTLDKDGNKVVDFDISAWLNINTRGGVLVWCAILTIIPIAAYAYFVSTGLEETTVGAYVGALFVLLTMVAWASTYIFRVATKDMTYAKQLRDYENAVLEKRLSELADDEIDALMREIELEGDEDANAPMKGMNNDNR